MTGTLFNKWYVSRLLFAVSRDDFHDTLRIMSRQIDKETGQTPSLKIAFYKASKKLHEVPEFNARNWSGKQRTRERFLPVSGENPIWSRPLSPPPPKTATPA